MKTKQKVILISGIFLAIYLVLLAFDKIIYSFFAIQINQNIHNLIFFIQQDLIFFPIVFLFGLACIYFRKEKKSKRHPQI